MAFFDMDQVPWLAILPKAVKHEPHDICLRVARYKGSAK